MKSKIQQIALFSFLFSINFEVWDPINSDGLFSISKLMGLLYISTIVSDLGSFIKVNGIKPILILIWVFFALLTLVSAININYVSASFFNFSIFQCILIFWIIINHERKRSGILSKGLVVFALGSITSAILFALNIGVSDERGRITLFGDNENIIGIRMAISIIIILTNVFQNKNNFSKLRFLLLLPLPLMLLLMAETGSRVAIISFFFALMLGITFFKTKNIGAKILTFGIGAGVFAGIVYIIMQSEVLIKRLILSSENRDLGGRGDIWDVIIPLIKENPIIGVGETGYAKYIVGKLGVFLGPHNVLLEVMCYVGIIGLIIYLIFLYRIFLISFRYYLKTGDLLQVLVLLPILGLLLTGQVLTSKLIWLLLGYIVSLQFKQNQTFKLDSR